MANPAPDWLAAALAPGSSTASKLIGYSIAYKWAPRDGGWALGIVTSVNKDKKFKLGNNIANFRVWYKVDKSPGGGGALPRHGRLRGLGPRR